MIRKTKSWPFSWPATFRKKWPVGPRRCPMSAKADAEAAAALRELGATLKASKEEARGTRRYYFTDSLPLPVPERLKNEGSHRLEISLTSIHVKGVGETSKF
jgi:hypothetical protein